MGSVIDNDTTKCVNRGSWRILVFEQTSSLPQRRRKKLRCPSKARGVINCTVFALPASSRFQWSNQYSCPLFHNIPQIRYKALRFLLCPAFVPSSPLWVDIVTFSIMLQPSRVTMYYSPRYANFPGPTMRLNLTCFSA